GSPTRPFPPEQRARILARVLASLTKRNLNPSGATAPTRARSSARGTTPTGSRPPPTWESATTAPPRSSWRTSRRSASQYDQLKLSGIVPWPHETLSSRGCSLTPDERFLSKIDHPRSGSTRVLNTPNTHESDRWIRA